MPLPARTQSVKAFSRSQHDENVIDESSTGRPTAENSTLTKFDNGQTTAKKIVQTSQLPRQIHTTVAKYSQSEHSTSGHTRSKSTIAKPPSSAHAGHKLTQLLPPQPEDSHARQRNIAVPKATVLRGHTRATSSIEPTAAQRKIITQPVVRPNFNTFQQQFSPRKALAKQSSPTSTLSKQEAEQIRPLIQDERLSDELLQLSLLHSNSHDCLNRYQRSAESYLRSRILSVTEKQAQLTVLDEQFQRFKSTESLQTWIQSCRDSPEQQIQNLGKAIASLNDIEAQLCGPQGPLLAFEEWYSSLANFQQIRQTGIISDPAMASASRLDPPWRLSLEPLKTTSQACRAYFDNMLPNSEVESATGIGFVLLKYAELSRLICARIDTALDVIALATQQERELERLELEAAIDFGVTPDPHVRRHPLWNED